jgi:hypothetical protein
VRVLVFTQYKVTDILKLENLTTISIPRGASKYRDSNCFLSYRYIQNTCRNERRKARITSIMIICYLVEKKSIYFLYHREEGRYLSQCLWKYFFFICITGYSCDDDGRLAGQEIPLLLWHPKVHISALKNLPLIRSWAKWTHPKFSCPIYIGKILLQFLHKDLGFPLRCYAYFSSISEVIFRHFKSLAKVTKVISYYFLYL